MKDLLIKPLNVINTAQQKVWDLHHKVKQYDEKLADEFWQCSLQIESALLKINENIYGGSGYWENKET